jgi:hypothetical protein
MKPNYAALETELTQLLADLTTTLTESEIKEVSTFIDAGEYGVAFETLCSVITEEDKILSRGTLAKLMELGQKLKVDPSWWAPIKQK